MKKTIAALFAVCTLLAAVAANAVPYTNTVFFGPNNVLSGQGTFTWDHAVTSDFQIPYDTVNSATLVITSRRAQGTNDIVSIVDLVQLGTLLAGSGNNGNDPIATTFNLTDYPGVFSAWASGSALHLSLAYDAGSRSNETLTMVSSLFSLDYNNNSAPEDPAAPVPEPASVVLLGAGIFGLAIYGKRRRSM